MAESIRWGILGTGHIAHSLATVLTKNDFTVTAVGSRRAADALAFADKFHIPTAYGSYADLVADPEIEVVYVATPHPFHAQHALLALGAGKHVLVEKPFTLNAAEAEKVVALAEREQLVVLEAMWTRFLPHMARIREIIGAGTLGELRSLIADHGQLLPSDPAHRINNPALGGGALLDLGIYPISFAYDILGAPDTVQAHATMTTTGVDRQTSVLFGYDDGREALLHAALDARGPNRASIVGTAGRIEIDNVWFAPTGFTVYDSNDSIIERVGPPTDTAGMQYQCWEIERRIKDRTPRNEDELPPRESVQIMKTLDTIREQIGLHYPFEE